MHSQSLSQKLNGLYNKDMQCYPEGLQESLKELETGVSMARYVL